jgi:hypothetical protein
VLALKITCMDKKPEHCSECIWEECFPNPFTGWTIVCRWLDKTIEDLTFEGRSEIPMECPIMEVRDDAAQD